MLLIISYSCFTSSVYVVIEFPICSPFIYPLQNVCTLFFLLDIILNLLRIPEGEVIQTVTHAAIAKKYLAIRFWLDIVATLPFYLALYDMKCLENENFFTNFFGSQFGSILKLVRLVRLRRINQLFDLKRFRKFTESLIAHQARHKKVLMRLILKNVWIVSQMISMTIMITFFVGCLFYGWSKYVSNTIWTYSTQKFITYYDLEHGEIGEDGEYENRVSIMTRLITAAYFSITTLSTVGYGDYSPKSNEERLFGVAIMLCGVAFFSLIMSSFIEIISTFDKNLGDEEDTFDLHNWMTLLTRFRDGKPLPNSLYRQINEHFKHYWENNRLRHVQKDSDFISRLPKTIKYGILVHYLFDDVFYNFRLFFNPIQNKDSKFLYDVSFGLKPRHFSKNEDECIIYDEEEQILEMYFIMSGTVGIGYQLFM